MKSKAGKQQRLAQPRKAEIKWEASSELIRRELATSELSRLKVKRQIVELKKQLNNEGMSNEN